MAAGRTTAIAALAAVVTWLSWKSGVRAAGTLRAGAGVAVLCGGAYSVYTAL